MKAVEALLPSARAVVVCTPDACGRLMGKQRPVRDWSRLAAHGLSMPDFHLVTGLENRPLSGFSAAGAELGFRNGRLLPDPAAAFVSPGDPATMHVIADVLTDDGREVAEAPRQILKAQIARLEAAGVTGSCASELEFYVFRQSFGDLHAQRYATLEPLYHRHGDNDVLVSAICAPFCRVVEEALAACGISVDQFQGEGGAGQFEVNVEPSHPLQAADEHVVFKHVVKAAAHAAGHAVTFLAKPCEADAGSGGHIHLSLRTQTGANALGGSDGQLSPFGQGFLAGLLAFTPELTLLHAPYANSYRRLVPGSFTPLRSTWGWDNRTALVRLIRGRDGPRLEFRLPGADANPYHAYAGVIAAGLGGVESGLAAPVEKIGAAEPRESLEIPGDLTEALARFAASAIAREAFGDAVHAHICGHARHELGATRRAVTSWEVARGFENA